MDQKEELIGAMCDVLCYREDDFEDMSTADIINMLSPSQSQRIRDYMSGFNNGLLKSLAI